MGIIDRINSPADLKKIDRGSLNILCNEIRKFLVQKVSRTGGHLASNLGVVELTVALHYCLDSPCDKILWDVGHQAYVHKILTGRKEGFDSLRKLDGLSGFPKKSESPHDFFDVGHSSTSISQALGLAVSRDLQKEDYTVAAVIGDGSMTGGLSFEALNNAGRSEKDMIVILNDNEMSISKNVGAMSRHLNEIRTSPSYLGVKRDVSKVLNKIPFVGKTIGNILEITKNSVRYVLVPGTMFEELGFKYIGPINGHNLNELIYVINRAKKIKGPVLLHVYTKKGKGYKFSEKNPCKFHGIDKFDIETGKTCKAKSRNSYSDVFGDTVLQLARENPKIVTVTAAMPEGTGLTDFQKEFPDRCFDVGIAEGHGATFSGALAEGGLIPVFAVYSTFLQRAYDHILHDICIQNSHVVLAIDRAGIVGSDGETHQGVFDISYLSHMPNMTIMAPKNKKEFQEMLQFAVGFNGPIAVRYPRGAASEVLSDQCAEIKLGEPEIIFEGSDIALVSFGAMMDEANKIYEKLKVNGYNPALINGRFAKPVGSATIEALKNYKYIFTFEDNVYAGGFGNTLYNALKNENIKNDIYHSFALPDAFIPQGTRDELFDRYELTAEKMYSIILKRIEG